MTKLKKSRCLLLIVEIIVLVGMYISYPSKDISQLAINMSTVIREALALVVLNISVFSLNRNLNNRWMIIFNALIAAIYSAILVVARAYIARGNLTLVWHSAHTITLCIVSWLAFTIVFYSLFFIFFNLATDYQINRNTLNNKNKIRFFLIVFCVLFLLFIPFLIISLPGIVSFDGMYQIDELFRESTAGGQYSLTNHNPILSTLVQGLFVKIGITLFHSINAGILLNTIFLNLLMITSMSFLVTVVAIYWNKLAALVLAAFLGLFPVFVLWANTLDKTGYFIALFIFFLSSLIILDENKTDIKALILLIVSGSLLGLFRNDGLIYLLFAALGSITLRERKKIVLSLAISFLLVIGLSKVMTNVTRALPTEPMESLSLPMQQIGRVVKYNPKSITNKEKKDLGQFFDYKSISKSYNPEYADKMKSISTWPYLQFKGSYKQQLYFYNEQSFVKNKKDFWKLWWQIGIKNKKLYFEALLGLNIFYLYPQDHPSVFSWIIGPNFGNSVFTNLFSNYGLHNVRYLAKWLSFLSKLTNWPIVKYLFISFTWFILWLLPSVSVINQKKYKYFNLVLVGGAIIAVSLLSPVNGLMRYTFPLIVLDPILWLVCFIKNSTLLGETNNA